MTDKQILHILKQELAPAVGCTEPVAVAYAAAKAKSILGRMPECAEIYVSRNILKNAMGVGIPGTDEVGLEMAAAMGIIGGKSEAVLEVLEGISEGQIQQAKKFAREQVSTFLKSTAKKLYIEVLLKASDDSVTVIIEDSHTNISRILHGEMVVYEHSHCNDIQEAACDAGELTVESIFQFICGVDIRELEWMDE